MTRRSLVEKVKTSLTIDKPTYDRVTVLSEMLKKTRSEIMTMAVEAGVKALVIAFDPENAGILKEIGEKYQNDLSAD